MRNLLLVFLASLVGVGVAVGAKRLFGGPSTEKPESELGFLELKKPEKVSASHPGGQSAANLPQQSFPASYASDSNPEKPIYLRGYVVRSGRFNALLSDGRTVTEYDKTVASIERHGVKFKDGTFVGFRAVQPALPVAESRQIAAPEKSAAGSPPHRGAAVEAPAGAVSSKDAYAGEALFPPSPEIGQIARKQAK